MKSIKPVVSLLLLILSSMQFEIIVKDSAGTTSSVAREWIDFEVTS